MTSPSSHLLSKCFCISLPHGLSIYLTYSAWICLFVIRSLLFFTWFFCVYEFMSVCLTLYLSVCLIKSVWLSIIYVWQSLTDKLCLTFRVCMYPSVSLCLPDTVVVSRVASPAALQCPVVNHSQIVDCLHILLTRADVSVAILSRHLISSLATLYIPLYWIHVSNYIAIQASTYWITWPVSREDVFVGTCFQ